MNVRERAKTFEAFMSSNSDSLVPENEQKRSNEETVTDLSGTPANNGLKDPGHEKQKPVPPPRKTRKIKVPPQPETPQSPQSNSPKPSPEQTKSAKPKIAPKKPPPPRPAPYKQLSSPSLTSHIPHAKTKELSASLSRRRKASEAKSSPRPSSGGSPVTPHKTPSREPPTKPPRGSPRSSPSSSPRITRSSPKRSSCEIQLTHGVPKDDSPEKTSKGDSPCKTSKQNPQRPPPPKRTSSLSRKIKPPVPPKPKRSPKTTVVQEKKAATIPRTGSIDSKESISTNASEEDLVIPNVEVKPRSLSSPLTSTEPIESTPVDSEEHAKVNSKNDLEESCKADDTLEHKCDDSRHHVNGVDELSDNLNIENIQSVPNEIEEEPGITDNNVLDTSGNIQNVINDSKDERNVLTDTEQDTDDNLQSSDLYKNENTVLKTNGVKEIVDNEIPIDEKSEEQNNVEHNETEVTDEKISSSQNITDEANENLNSSSASFASKAEGQPEEPLDVDENKSYSDNEAMDVKLDENKDINASFIVTNEPMETSNDDFNEENGLAFHSDKVYEDDIEIKRTHLEGEISCENDKSLTDNSNKNVVEEHESDKFVTDNIIESPIVNDLTSEQQVESNELQESVLYHPVDHVESDLNKEEDSTEDQMKTFEKKETSLGHSEENLDVGESLSIEPSQNEQENNSILNQETTSNYEEHAQNELSIPEEKERMQISMNKDVHLEDDRTDEPEVADVKSSSPETNDLKDTTGSKVSNVSTTTQHEHGDAKRSSYMETSLDEDFFNGENTTREHFTDEEVPEIPQDEPFETEIDLEVAVINTGDKDSQEDQHPLEADTVIASEIEPQEPSSEQVAVVNDSMIDSQEVQSLLMSDSVLAEEEPNESESSISSERVSQYENVALSSEKDQGTKELRPEPIKPARPSRQKKKKHIYENTSLSQPEKVFVKVEKEEIVVETEIMSPAPPTRSNMYENTSIRLQEEVEVIAVTDEEETPKRSDIYENTVILAQSIQTQNEENSADILESPASTSLKPKETPSQRESKQPSYENVKLANDDIFADDDSIYQVPRRKSFSSESPTTSFERSSKRSASVGSMDRKKVGRNVMQTFQTEAESTYVVPTTRSSSQSEEVYVAPRNVRAVTEETYVTPKSVKEEVYVAPRTIRTSSNDPEDMCAAPREIIAADAEEMYVAPRAIPSATERTSESEYHVPSSPSKERPPSDEYKVPVSPSKTRSSTVGSESAVIITDEPFPEEETRLRRSTRSSVLTSREQVKAAPAKPPRLSDADLSEQPLEKPKPTPRTLDASPKASPRPKPRKSQDHSTGDVPVEEKTASEPAPPEVVNDNAAASPKPKRPAPPRPKAPSFSVGSDKSSTTENESETRHRAPPRPPPPSLNRVSVLSSELESLPGSPMESSSESEEEQPPVPKGPPKKKTYHIAHEILSTERTFVTALTLCYEDCYGLIKAADVVPETTLNDIFKDLGNIYHLDVKFLNELEERMKTWEESERIGDIVKKYSYFLKMYTTYINHYDKAVCVLQETIKENLQFAELVQEFQASEKCSGLFLGSFMLKPVQRIPSYRLLLIDYLKHLPQDSEEFKDIKVALDIVSEVATHINESMKKSDNLGKVLSIQESIVGNAEIVKPGREFIKEGTLQKLCRKDMQERTFFLLTDVLLYTSAVGGGQYKLKGTFPLLGVKVELPDSPEFENEFSIISKSRSFTLSASTQAERDEWIEEIREAISALTRKKSTFKISKDGALVPPAEGDLEESKLGDKAPVWIQDTRVTMCMLCTDKFTVTNRRHHCRGCGKVVCGSCSDNLAPLAYLDYAQARVCEVCYEVLLKEQNKSIKETPVDIDHPPPSPVGIAGDDLDKINRKPAKFEILHRFKPGSKKSNRKSKIITARPSVRTEVVGHDSESQMSGYLRFKRSNKHGWKRVWFVLKANVLYTYKASEDVVAMETIPILGYVVQEATRTETDEIQFQLKHAGLPPISFKTETESSAFRWIQELKKATTL